jgi:hypothetical protein
MNGAPARERWKDILLMGLFAAMILVSVSGFVYIYFSAK